VKTHKVECTARSRAELDFVDITDDVRDVLEGSGIRNGQVTVFSPAASCALFVNERESGLLIDLQDTIRRLRSTEADERPAMLGSSSVVVPAVEGKLRLGTWQRLLMVELERGEARKLIVQIVGE
jgi:secondary thiamine-phosphate synthase enzyme